MSLARSLLESVRARAGDRCEYCRINQALQSAIFHVEHIHPTSKGGSSTPDNLAWSCPTCNFRKAARDRGIDPQTGESVPLFHPRRDRWADHFEWKGYQLTGRTPIGRATVEVLRPNEDRRITIRSDEGRRGLFPPEDF